MAKYVQDRRTGHMKGSIGDGKTRIPTSHEPAPETLTEPETKALTVAEETDLAYAQYVNLRPRSPMPHLTGEELPSEIRDVVNSLHPQLRTMLIPDNSASGRSSASFIPLTHMTDPTLAKNNCFNTATAVHAALIQSGLPEGWEALTSDLWFVPNPTSRIGGSHWANVLRNTRTGEQWVLDYTASQFNPDAPFPLVARHPAWRTWVCSVIRNRYGHELHEEKLHH